jgi:streptogramin lyase
VVTATVDFAFEIYDLPTADSDPHDLVIDESAGVVWFTQRGVDKIGRLTLATAQIDEFAMPVGSQPTGITLGSGGLLWLTFPGTNQIGRFDPSTEIVSTYNYPRANAGFTGIKQASNGLLWAVAPADNRLVSFNPSNEVFVNVVVGNFGSPPIPPHSMVLQGTTPWITVPSTGWLGRYSPGTLNLWYWYATASSPAGDGGSTALALRNTPEGNQEFWYLQPSSNRAGRMLINGQGQRVDHFLATLPTGESQATGIAVDTNGHAWVTATAANSIVEWRPPYTVKIYLPIISR